MRILFITGEYPPQPGGVGDYTRRLGQALVRNGHEALVVTVVKRKWQIWQVTSDGDRVLLAPAGRAGWGIGSLGRLTRLVHQVRPDWCHIQYQTGAYQMKIGVNLLPLLLRRSRLPTAITYHDLLPPYLFPKAGVLREWVTLLPARTARAVIVTNPEDETTLRAARVRPHLIPIGANIDPVLPEGYDRSIWRADLGLSDEMPLIGYFGLLSPGKGIDLLIDLIADQPAWRLLIIGGAATSPTDRVYAKTIQQRLETLALRDRVIITGHIAAERVSAYLHACDLMVLPFRDGASLRRGSLLAALAHGCAVITTPPASPATAAALTGVVHFAAAHPESLKTAIISLLSNTNARLRLSEAARQAARRFDWQNIAAAHLELYRSL